MSGQAAEEAGLAVRRALPSVDVLIGNEPELKLVAATDTLESSVAKLRSENIPMLVSKLASEGTRVYTGDSDVFCVPDRVPVVSTIGAADGFAACVLAARLRRKE